VPLQEMAKEVSRSRCRHSKTIATTGRAFKTISKLHSIRVQIVVGRRPLRAHRPEKDMSSWLVTPGTNGPCRQRIRANSPITPLVTEELCRGI
jgi:hypothetical protein